MKINYNTVYEYLREPNIRNYYIFKYEIDQFYITDLIKYGNPITIKSDRLLDKEDILFFSELTPLDNYEYRNVMMMVWSGIYEK